MWRGGLKGGPWPICPSSFLGSHQTLLCALRSQQAQAAAAEAHHQAVRGFIRSLLLPQLLRCAHLHGPMPIGIAMERQVLEARVAAVRQQVRGV